jgi:hypothetical protein
VRLRQIKVELGGLCQHKVTRQSCRGVLQLRWVLGTAAAAGGDLARSCAVWLDAVVRAELEEGYCAKAATRRDARAR